MKVCVIGLGYIGLPTATLIASRRIEVLGVDLNENIVETVNKGKIHIIEPDLEGLVYDVVSKGLLKASTRPEKSDVFIITVQTPLRNKFLADISFVEKAIESITPILENENLVIIESTVPVGTTEEMYEYITKSRPELSGKFFMAHCPERVIPGRIIYELVHNDRVIGGIDRKSADKAKEFYSIFVKGDIYTTDSRTSEMCKLVENAYRDVNIAFANEISLIADEAGINIWELIELANKHPRVNILSPGIGVGGHCIAVDPWFLISAFPSNSKLMKTAREVNTYKTEWVIQRIKKEIEDFKRKNGRKPKVVCFGVAYKPDTDDIRESPALYIIKKLISDGEDIIVVDPVVKSSNNSAGVPIELYDQEYAESRGDIFVFLVAHKIFEDVMNKLLKSEVQDRRKIMDFCGIRYKVEKE